MPKRPEKFKISIVVPVYNEEEGILMFHTRLTDMLIKEKYEYEIIYVNDGSKDNTVLAIGKFTDKSRNVKLINFSKNFGHQVAVSAGLDYTDGDAVVIIDADLQDPPEVIPELVAKWIQGYDIVNAKRRTRKDSFFKKFTAKVFYRLLNSLIPNDIPENVGDFRLLDSNPVKVLRQFKEKNRYLRGLTNWIGYKQTFVEFDRDQRYAGETHYPLKKMFQLGFNAIFSFSVLPLKIANYIAAVFVLIAVAVFAYVVGSVLNGEVVAGWASQVLIFTIFSSIQLFMIGIMSEYISRIYNQVQDRPLYIVSDLINIKSNDKEIK